MDQRVLAEHVLDRPPQRLAAVEDEQDRLLGIQAPVDQISEQRPRQRRVLGRALPQPERDLHPLGGDTQRDDVNAAGDLQPVEHHHRQPHVIQPAGHQLPQRGAGLLDEHLRHRALPLRRRGLLDLFADRLADPGELPGRDAGEHPVHHRPLQRIAIGEVLVGRDRQLALAVDRCGPSGG